MTNKSNCKEKQNDNNEERDNHKKTTNKNEMMTKTSAKRLQSTTVYYCTVILKPLGDNSKGTTVRLFLYSKHDIIPKVFSFLRHFSV